MPICASCGNNYAKTFQINFENQTYNFDCFECAINKLAPICQNCGCRIIGHGVESDKYFYCCSHCARNSTIDSNAKISSSKEVS
jgi:hypothetical protein